MKRRINTKEFNTTLFCLLIYATSIVDVFRIVNNTFLHMGDSFTTLFRNIFYIVLFLLVFLTFLKDRKSLNRFVVFSVAYIIAVCISYVVNSEIDLLIRNNILMFFSRIAPAYVIAGSIDDFEQAFSKVTKWRWFVLLYIILFLFAGMTNARFYYMNVGYNLLYPTLILLFTNEKKQLLNKIVAFISIAIILLFCARGTALVLIPSIVAFYIIQTFRIGSDYKKFFVIVGLIAIAVILMVFLDTIFKYLYKLFPDSRTLYYIMHGDILNSSGRDNYYEAGIAELMAHPFKIRGILGDRYFYGKAFHIKDFEGAFAHNFTLEIMLQFGFIPGLVISVLFLKQIIVAVVLGLKSNRTAVTVAVCSIIVPSFVISMTTASYLSSIETCLMLGICSSIIRNQKKPKRKLHEKDDVIRRISTASRSY